MTTYSKFLINGSEVHPNQIKVNKALGDINTASTFSARINNYTGRFTGSYGIGDEIKIYSDKDINPPTTQIFLGILEDINLTGNEEREQMVLSGKDYSTRLIDRTVEPEAYNNLPAGSIVKDIIAKYTDDITTTNVNDGVNVERIVFNHVPVFDAIKELAGFAGFMFYVDNDKDLHFEEPSTASSGYTFGSGGTPVTNASFKERRNEIFNEIWVYGDRYLDGFAETLTGDGTGSEFTLLYKPSNTSITVDSQLVQPGAVYGMAATAGSDVKYLVNYDDSQIIFTSGTLQGDNIPGAGSSIVVSYMRDLPIIKYGDNTDSVETYGKKVKVIQDTSIKDPVTAETILLQELEDLSDPLKQGTLNINGIGNINPGETCIVNIPSYDINSVTYDILEAKYNMTKSNMLADEVLSIKVNKEIPDVTDTLKDIMLSQRKLQGQNMSDADLLTRYKVGTGSFGIRQSGITIWERGIGSSFILGHDVNGLLGSYTSHTLGDWRGGSSISWSGGYF